MAKSEKNDSNSTGTKGSMIHRVMSRRAIKAGTRSVAASIDMSMEFDLKYELNQTTNLSQQILELIGIPAKSPAKLKCNETISHAASATESIKNNSADLNNTFLDFTSDAIAQDRHSVADNSDNLTFINRPLDKSQASAEMPPEVCKTRIKPRPVAHHQGVETPMGVQTQVLKGRFLLEKVIGVGGMGVVYKAKDRLKVEAEDSEPYVAIKVLNEEFKSHPKAFVALHRESKKSQRIAHPNVVKVYDFDRDGDVVYMTMEYMSGEPLDLLLQQYCFDGLPKKEAWTILSGICSALIQAHKEKIVHSDLKPGNIYVTDEGMAKVFDFGVARAVANIDRYTGKQTNRTVFDAGSLGALTPAYASYEMLKGKIPDTRDDIYALGCIAYEIYSGEHPYGRLPADEAYKKKLKPKRIPGIGKSKWKAIESALKFKRSERIESVEKFYALLSFKSKPNYLLIASILAMALGSILWSADVFEPEQPFFDHENYMRVSELERRYNVYKITIDKLLSTPSFTDEWEDDVWGEMQDVYRLFPAKPSSWYLNTEQEIYALYLTKIKQSVHQEYYHTAKALLEKAERYTANSDVHELERMNLFMHLYSEDKFGM